MSDDTPDPAGTIRRGATTAETAGAELIGVFARSAQIRATGSGLASPATPNWVDRQGYLGAAPAGVDAQLAWTIPGGGGCGVRIIDCEWGWRVTHEDLLANQGASSPAPEAPTRTTERQSWAW